LLPLEEAILAAAIDLDRSGDGQFHGFAMAKRLTEDGQGQRLTAHGTLYKALGRMEAAGWLESRWEDADLALTEGRPRRRLYRITGATEQALSTSRAEHGRVLPRPREGLATT